MNDSARKLLRSAMNEPWWQVRWDAQVGLHLDCGTPRLESDGMWQRRVLPRGATKLVPSRVVRVLGTHWLWFAPQAWRIALADGLAVSDTSSARARDFACARLKGEMLARVRIDVVSSASVFEFDLGSPSRSALPVANADPLAIASNSGAFTALENALWRKCRRLLLDRLAAWAESTPSSVGAETPSGHRDRGCVGHTRHRGITMLAADELGADSSCGAATCESTGRPGGRPATASY